MTRTLVVLGVLLVAAGLAWPWLSKLPLGRLPGDLVFHGTHTTVHVSITTMLLVNVLVSVLLWLIR